jgi:hypothetical protein
VFSRAVFVFDYRDSELFHLLEDTIRQQVCQGVVGRATLLVAYVGCQDDLSLVGQHRCRVGEACGRHVPTFPPALFCRMLGP